MKIKLALFFTFIIGLWVNYSYCQIPLDLTADPNYYCGFEDPVENAEWGFYAHPNDPDLGWSIGTAVKCDGQYGLYVSPDNGATAGHTAVDGFYCAYRDFLLPSGNFRISWDWLKPSSTGKMYMCILDQTDINMVDNNGYGDFISWSGTSTLNLPTWVKLTCRPWVPGDTLMERAKSWQHGAIESYRVTSAQAPKKVRLLFFWSSNSSSGSEIGGAIDNIQIAPTSCGTISDISYKVEDGKGVFSWKSTGASSATYELMYKHKDESTWKEESNISQTSFTIDDLLDQGIYMIRIRMTCQGGYGMWFHFYSFPILSTGCLDFWDIHNPQIAEATHGEFNDPYKHKEVLDYGPSSNSSRLTVHMEEDERDAKTGNKLKTIPDGELASVRLGNSNVGAQGESVTYNYFVENDVKLLLMKYAVVLENPGHGEKDQPKFTLEILDEDDTLIGNECGEEEFITGKNTNDWEKYGSVEWKHWTSIGINLEKHIGKNLRIRLTTYDCNHGGHFGYAYFTLQCISSAVQGLTCGDEDIEVLNAPEGFTYEWRDKNNPSLGVISTAQNFYPPADISTVYECRMIFKEGCFFTQDINVAPRFPKSDFKHHIDFVDCEAKVSFTNTSYVDVGGTDRENIDSFQWDFDNGSKSILKNPTTTYTENGTYMVELISEINNGGCTDTIRFPVVITGLGDYDNDTVRRHLCTSDIPYIHDGVEYYQTDTHILPYKSKAGCDSTIILQVEFHDLFEIEVEDILYQYKDPYYDFNGRHLTESDTYIDTLQSRGGCDSIVTLILTSYEAIHIRQIDSYPTACAEDNDIQFTYEILSGNFTTYSLKFDEKAEQAGFQSSQNISKPAVEGIIEVSIPLGVLPGNYSVAISFEHENYGYDTLYIDFSIYYPAAIAEQKWNDVITLLNDKHNGGYEFSNYQWYKNGYPISGATHSYYYEPGDLDFSAEYIVEITRKDDGVTTFTCPIEIERRTDNGNMYPTIVSSGSSITLDMQESGQGVLWDIMGLKHREYNLQSENNQLTMPSKPGVYYLQIKTNSGERQILNIIVR